jgi:hypothetical protein
MVPEYAKNKPFRRKLLSRTLRLSHSVLAIAVLHTTKAEARRKVRFSRSIKYKGELRGITDHVWAITELLG